MAARYSGARASPTRNPRRQADTIPSILAVVRVERIGSSPKPPA
jgi:hypothetical protein